MDCTYMDLIDAFGYLEAMVDNIIDSTVFTATYFVLFLFRFNKLIKRTIIIVKQEIAASRFENMEEMHLYFAYHNISDKFARYIVPTSSAMVFLIYLLPLFHLINRDSGMEITRHRKLTRAYPVIDYKQNLNAYIVMYLYQFPLIHVGYSHTVAVSMILSMALHICGKFSVLSYRVQNIPVKSNIDLNSRIKELVIAHLKLLLTTNLINSALQIFLLMDLSQTVIRLGVVMYNATENIMGNLTYCFYIVIVVLILYLYSFIGERLLYESSNVSEAYYDTDWHNLSIHNKKLLLLVMSAGRQPMYFTAGKFYTFSLNGFIGPEFPLLFIIFDNDIRTAFGHFYQLFSERRNQSEGCASTKGTRLPDVRRLTFEEELHKFRRVHVVPNRSYGHNVHESMRCVWKPRGCSAQRDRQNTIATAVYFILFLLRFKDGDKLMHHITMHTINLSVQLTFFILALDLETK
ncbi:unnamed protein product [Xylocopa violacea]|uniref:Odorant receptor n=1 Tax=Xylocopa violacea TaxID=135666 RepID=A0ABP1NWM3_XYLVO